MLDAIEEPAEAAPRYAVPPIRRIWFYFVPLAASLAVNSLETPLVNSALARSPDPQVALASFAVALSLVGLLSSPARRLQQTCLVLVNDDQCRKQVSLFVVWSTAVMTGAVALMGFTPLGELVLTRWINVPGTLLAPALYAIRLLILYPVTLAWRFYSSSLVIRKGDSLGMWLSLIGDTAVVVVVLLVGMLTGWLMGAALGAAALILSRAFAGLIAQWRANTAGAQLKIAPNEVYRDLTQWRIVRFLPLTFSVFLQTVGHPIVQSGVSRAAEPQLSLAAIAVAMSMMSFMWMAVSALQPTVLAMLEREASYAFLRNFSLLVGLAFTALSGLIAYTPLADLFLRDLIGASADLLVGAKELLRYTFLLPFIMSVEQFYDGLIMRSANTMPVTYVTLWRLGALATILTLGVMFSGASGIKLAGCTYLVFYSVESLAAYFYARPKVRQLLAAESA